MSYEFSFDKKTGLLTLGCLFVAGLLFFLSGFLLGIGRSGSLHLAGSPAMNHSRFNGKSETVKSSSAKSSNGEKTDSQNTPAAVASASDGQNIPSIPRSFSAQSNGSATNLSSSGSQVHGSGKILAQHYYCLQFGSFREKGNANNLVKTLKKKGVLAEVVVFGGSSLTTWYVVRSGKYFSIDKAAKSASEIKKSIRISALVRRTDAI